MNALSQAAALGTLVAVGTACTPRQAASSLQQAIHLKTWNLPTGSTQTKSLLWDINLQLQLLALSDAFTPVYLLQRDHFTEPMAPPPPPPRTHEGLFPGISLDPSYILIYYVESQTFSCSKKCHFTSPWVPLCYHFNTKQEHAFEASPPIASTLLSLASQPRTASVHEDQMPFGWEKNQEMASTNGYSVHETRPQPVLCKMPWKARKAYVRA